ncbi:MAG: DUF4337 domain-containing protein [Acidiferrobacteraceae bacterium]
MSSDEFHAHGAHEHEVHKAGLHGGLAQWVAIFTALLSTFGAVVSYEGNLAQNEALLFKNEAVLKQTQAADQWSFYEAKSSKAHLMEFAGQMLPARAAYYHKRQARYEREKGKIRADATALEQQFQHANDKSARFMAPHYRLAQAITLIQIAISLASVTALTRRRWLLGFAGAAAATAVLLWVAAVMGLP